LATEGFHFAFIIYALQIQFIKSFKFTPMYEGDGKKNPTILIQARNLLAMITIASKNTLINTREINK